MVGTTLGFPDRVSTRNSGRRIVVGAVRFDIGSTDNCHDECPEVMSVRDMATHRLLAESLCRIAGKHSGNRLQNFARLQRQQGLGRRGESLSENHGLRGE